MYLFGLGVVLLPMWIALTILAMVAVIIVVGLWFTIALTLAAAIYFPFRNWINDWSPTVKKTTTVVLLSPFLVLLSIGLFNAPGVAWCELVRDSYMDQGTCEKTDPLLPRWMFALPRLMDLQERTRNTKAGTPEQEEAIRQSLPDQSSSP